MSFFRAFGGEGNPGGDLREQLLAIGGSSPRSASGVNISAAAKRLKINERTIRGWLNEGRHPSGKSSRRVRTLARNAGRTKAGRKATVERARAEGAFAGVRAVSISGMQGPRRSGKDYARLRTISVPLGADDLDRLQAAYANGGEGAVDEELTGIVEREYMPGWGVQKYDDDGGGLSWH